jgi:hypothetical protein
MVIEKAITASASGCRTAYRTQDRTEVTSTTEHPSFVMLDAQVVTKRPRPDPPLRTRAKSRLEKRAFACR